MSILPFAARTDGSAGDVPDVINRDVAGTESFLKGTVLKDNGSNAFTEAGAGVNTALWAVAMEEAVNGEPSNPTAELSAVRINRQTVFAFPVETGGAITEDVAGNVNVGDTGDLSVVSDVYAFDADSSASAALEVIEIWDERNLVLCKFIATTIK